MNLNILTIIIISLLNGYVFGSLHRSKNDVTLNGCILETYYLNSDTNDDKLNDNTLNGCILDTNIFNLLNDTNDDSILGTLNNFFGWFT